MTKIVFLIPSLLLFAGCSFFGNQVDNEIQQQEEQRTTFYEDYIHIITNNKEEPILVETFSEVESKFFIEKITQAEIEPEYIIKAGNELYFIARVHKTDEGDGQALLMYDALDRRFRELYFYKKDANNVDVDLILQAIDVEGNTLVVVLKKGESNCGSLWLSQSDNFYTFDLLDYGEDGLVKYTIPKWKIGEEKDIFLDCMK